MKAQSRIKRKPEQLVLEFFDRVWHIPHELDAIDELMTEDYKITTAGNLINGRENFKNWIEKFQKLLLEAKTENVKLFFNEAENKVVSRWVCSGIKMVF
ncbi:nuclear transport factor 2 family protein [bacterium AH-315-P13]|nr:nuclear transport factor 2 family protein [bacterium AH-315-P13]